MNTYYSNRFIKAFQKNKMSLKHVHSPKSLQKPKIFMNNTYMEKFCLKCKKFDLHDKKFESYS